MFVFNTLVFWINYKLLCDNEAFGHNMKWLEKNIWMKMT